MSLVHEPLELGVLYASGLFDGDEQCFEYGQTYEAFLAEVPFDLESGALGVVLCKDGVIHGWLKKRTATPVQFRALQHVFHSLRCGHIIKVTITSVGNLSRPRFDGRISRDREFCHGTARYSREVSLLAPRMRTLVGQVDISFGSKLYAREAPFVRGGRYVLQEERVPLLGGEGIALKQEDPVRHCGYVSRDTIQVVEPHLDVGKRVVAEVTSAWEGNQRNFCRRLRTERDWWNGCAVCWVEEDPLELEASDAGDEAGDEAGDDASVTSHESDE